jgi:hypothetical protein
MIDDAEIRGWLLKHFHRLRDANGGWCPTDEIILSPHPVSRPAIANACQHLADAGYIRWEPFNPPIERLAIGRAKITGPGIDVVTGARLPTIDIRFPGVGERGASPSYLAPAGSLLAPAPTAAEILGGSRTAAPSAPLLEIAAPASLPPEVKKNELLTLKPTIWGMSVDLKEAWRRLWSWWKEQK